MISKDDIQRLIHRENGGPPVLSVFLDMSVTSDNKRTFRTFLQQRRAQFAELDSDRENHHREAIGAAFARVERWIDDNFEEANKGLALYTEVGGDWLDGMQFPVPVPNRTEVDEHPVVGPLAQIVESYDHHGVLLVDREHLRMISVYLGTPVHEHTVDTQPFPAHHDVQRGGYSATDYQKRKAEETRHFFKEFALEVVEFDRRYRPDDLIVLGTDANVKQFIDFLPAQLQQKVVHTGHAAIDATAGEVLERLAPFFQEQIERQQASAIQLLHDRVRQNHLAVSGIDATLEHLQEGKVDTLVLAKDVAGAGARCERCGFYIARVEQTCPYCGGALQPGIDLVEAMVRMAEEQEIDIEFVSGQALTEVNGVGALLKF